MHVHSFLQTPLHLHGVKSKIANSRRRHTPTAPLDSAMIVDLADEAALAPVNDGRRHWWPSALDQAARPSGRWPTPPSGTPHTARCVLRAGSGSPKVARDFTRTTLDDWHMRALADDVLVVVSELVTNAFRHGLKEVTHPARLCPIQLVVFGYSRRLVTVVSDPSNHLPTVSELQPDHFGEGGRGLVVVAAISSAWGWAPLGTGGKAVWAAFDLSPLPGGR